MHFKNRFSGIAVICAAIFVVTTASAQDKKPNKPVAAQCPVMGNVADAHARQTAAGAMSNGDWWPNQLNLQILNLNSPMNNPLGEKFNYAEEFSKLNLEEVKEDLEKLMTENHQDWWPADYDHYGPFFIRMAWHSAGTYRIDDGRGGASDGTLRFAPLNSWPDNGNLDKARRLLWPIKQKYGQKISWADLIILAGNSALDSMGFKTMGYAGGREDVWEPQTDVFWGPETKWLDGDRYSPEKGIEYPLGATQMGLIYVNPEGPKGQPDPLAAAKAIREAFGNMAMNDEETVALIAGGHTFGKAHGAADPKTFVGPEPEEAGIELQGLGWKNSKGKGNAEDTITSGLEGAWTKTPAKFSHDYFDHLLDNEWELTKSPAGAHQWIAKGDALKDSAPDAHIKSKRSTPIMFTTDLALKMDPAYSKISQRYHEHPEQFEQAFAKAWYKLIHRDLGPVTRCLGPWVAEPQLFQDPVPKVDFELVNERDIADLKTKILGSGLSTSDLVGAAWSSAASFRGTDNRGGANGARIRLVPQKDWEVNQPAELAKILAKLEEIQQDYNKAQSGKKKVSLADVIVLGGCAAVEDAAKKGGHQVKVPFKAGRTDATQEMTDVESFAPLQPQADGFRNFQSNGLDRPVEEALIDRANMLTLTVPEMTVLVGGLRVLGTNVGSGPLAKLGVFTEKPGTLSNDFFVNLLDMNTKWEVSPMCEHFFEGKDYKSSDVKWTGSRVDLVFGSNSQLRAVSEVYASEDAKEKFINDFVYAWTKVMNLDRFDLDRAERLADKPAIVSNK